MSPHPESVAYQPLILEHPSLETLRSRAYRTFLHESVFQPGIRLILRRAARRPDWPYIDTKFNPNLGMDLPPESYERIYPWFLGRGLESLVLHLRQLDQFDLGREDATAARALFPRLLAHMTDGVLRLLDRYEGRCPFLVDRHFSLVPVNGSLPELDPELTGAGDLFCAKGLLLQESADIRERGAKMLERIGERVEAGLFRLEGARMPAQGLSQSMRMLFLAIPRLLSGREECEAFREPLFARSCRFLEFVLDRHFDSASGRFSEYIDPGTGERGELLDPGHCTEFVGLALSAIYAMEKDGRGMTAGRRALFTRAKREMPRILQGAMRLGFNAGNEGIFKAVNNRTGAVIDFDMPWWNLPETMRAAFFCALAAEETSVRDDCLQTYKRCHNAYFRHYLNPDMMLFPFQTRDGKTGAVLDSVPSIPEGDPLYHSNLCFLDMLPFLHE